MGAVVGLSLAPVLLIAPASYAAVEPAEPTVLFEEGFENTGTAPVLLTDYTGPTGVEYTADSQWLEACNGNILAGNAVAADITLTNCNQRSGGFEDPRSVNAYYQLRQLSVALGTLNGDAEPESNHMLSAFTDGKDPGAGIQLLSSAVAVPANRFVALSIDAGAVNCKTQPRPISRARSSISPSSTRSRGRRTLVRRSYARRARKGKRSKS